MDTCGNETGSMERVANSTRVLKWSDSLDNALHRDDEEGLEMHSTQARVVRL